jgi:prephenate dehydratase
MSGIGQGSVGHLGVPGAYTHQAAEELFPQSPLTGFKSFQQVVRAVEKGDLDFGVLPVENSTAGRVAEAYQLLDVMDLQIIAEHFVRVQHCLARRPGRSGEPVRSIMSHPQALMQCEEWLRTSQPDANQINTTDTATAAKEVAASPDPGLAAICSKRAAEIYGLDIVQTGIQDRDDNTTRFHVLSRGRGPAPVGPAITTLVFQISHKPGALISALTPLSAHNVNVLKLETYMASGQRTAPTFYIDIALNRYSDEGEKVLSSLSKSTTFLKTVGCYGVSPLRGTVPGFLGL